MRPAYTLLRARKRIASCAVARHHLESPSRFDFFVCEELSLSKILEE
jgi:hypothetical protein